MRAYQMVVGFIGGLGWLLGSAGDSHSQDKPAAAPPVSAASPKPGGTGGSGPAGTPAATPPAPAAGVTDEAGPSGTLSEEELKQLQGAVPKEAKAGNDVFDEGVRYYYAKDYPNAAKRLWDYMAGNDSGAENIGYAEFFLAGSLENLGFTHAAVEYFFNVAKNRSKVELLPDALMALEKISREHPFDSELILKDLLYDTNFGYVREDLRDFVEYHQGYLDYSNGFISWGQKHFSHIRKGTYYDYKARYVQAVYELVNYNIEAAYEKLHKILASDIQQADVVNNARQSLARLLFEQKKYEEAYKMYESIDAPIEKQAAVFLEEAWTQYYLKNYQRAMGLLYALEAPSFYRYFNPERYVLKALIYMNLCHYNVAKDAVSEFRSHYGDAIQAIYDRVDLEKNDILLDATLQHPAIVQISSFQKLLDTEMGLLANFEPLWLENGLIDRLRKIYDLKIKDVNRRLKESLDRTVRQVSESLLEFEEQMNLMDYEIGLAIYKRIKGTPSQKDENKLIVPYSSEKVYYNFDGEFWNDELHDFQFFIEDRCFSAERWE